jgi:hypothetical protein
MHMCVLLCDRVPDKGESRRKTGKNGWKCEEREERAVSEREGRAEAPPLSFTRHPQDERRRGVVRFVTNRARARYEWSRSKRTSTEIALSVSCRKQRSRLTTAQVRWYTHRGARCRWTCFRWMVGLNWAIVHCTRT